MIKNYIKNNFRIPDSRIPSNYFIAIAVQSIGALVFVCLFVCVLLMFIGISQFSTALAINIQCDLKEINDDVIAFEMDPTPTKIIDMKQKLNQAIVFHTKTLQ